ncbi:MAG: ADP-ribosylation factor-like protein [Candidatus Hodarchaeota archaeon]
MSFLGKIFSRSKSNKQEAKIVLLGSSGAGKTTLVRYLETGEPVETDPKTTLGIDIRKTPINLDGWSFKAIDVGGQELYQKTFWALGIGQADAVIYVIDGTTKQSESNDAWETAMFQFDYMLGLIEHGMPLLVLVNKQDLKELDPLSTEEAIRLYGMQKLVGRSFVVLPSSAKYGDGVQNAMEWLVEKIAKEKSI